MCLYISSLVSVVLVFSFPFIMTEVVNSFSECRQFFLNGEPPVIPGILEDSVSKNKNYVLICQKYMNDYRFATLYDTANRIPVFSAYKFTGNQEEKTQRKNKDYIPWKIERQLEPSGAEMKVPFVNQASKGDYCTNDLNLKLLNHGHLFPDGHAADDLIAESTYTLTNIVPQKNRFNNGPWSVMEKNVGVIMNKLCRDRTDNNRISAYVLTGAVPGDSKLNERVNIPSHMWTVFCCYHKTKKTFISKAHWAKNENEDPVQSTSRGKRHRKDKNKIPQKTLEELEKFLGVNNSKIRLFDSCSDVNLDESDLPDTQAVLNNVEDQGLPCDMDALNAKQG